MTYMNLLCLQLKKLNKGKMLYRQFFLSSLLFVFIMSCTLFSGSIETSSSINDNAEKLIQEKGLCINSITVNKSFDSTYVRANAMFAFDVLLGLQTGRPENGLKTDAVFKEESFVKGFDQRNSVSLELTVKDIKGCIIKIVLITEESENTLSSYKYLYGIIEKGIREAGF